MKKIAVLSSAVLIMGNAYAVTYEYPYLYKDPRALGMGGAYVAVGGTASSVFYNPAGIGNINTQAGWEINLLKLNVGISEDTINFVNDLMDALDAQDGEYITPPDGDDADDQLYAVNEVLKDYQGKNLHIDISNFTSVARKWSKIGFTVGFLTVLKSDNRTHEGFGSEGIWETNSNITAGGVIGLSYDSKFRENRLTGGVSVKYMYRESLVHNFTSRELVEHEDNLDTYITEDLTKSGTALGFDIGAIYSFAQESFFRPSVGFSLLNIGDLDFGEAGKIPMTSNIGVALRPQINFLKDWLFAFDYVDIFNGYEEDSDIGKRIRLGAEVKVWDNSWTSFVLRTGLYQGYLTGGVDLRLALVNFNFTTYAEEVGAYSGQDSDRRYLVGLYIGW